MNQAGAVRSRDRAFSRMGRLGLVGGLAAALMVSVAQGASAQTAERPTISIAANIAAEPATQVGLPIRVGPPAAIPRNAFVRVRGLPQTAALSEGHSIAPGAWAVPMSALPALKIALPATATGRHELLITLVAGDGTVLVEGRTSLVISSAAQATQPPREVPAATILRAGTPPKALPSERSERPAPAGPAMGAEERERAMRLLKKGEEQLVDGNVAAARLFFERAADAGLAQAAMALASTYDAAELGRLNVRGIQPDAKQAQRWYERARQLGDAGADQRLRRLGAN